MGRLETNGYYALGVPGYVLLVMLELWLTRRKKIQSYQYSDTFGNLSAGLGEIIIGLFIGPSLIALYDFGYENYALIQWEDGSLIPWVLALFVSDLCYYWYHRAGHKIGVFWAIHGVHHQSEQFNVTVAMRHPWFSDFYSAPFYAPLPLLGVSPTQFFLAISLISFYSLSIHSKTFHRPSFFLLTTPATHIAHHCQNPRYIGKNLGAMFTLWDRLFGTYVEVTPDDPPRLGTPYGYETHNGARSQWIYWRDLWQSAKGAGSLRERLGILFGRPGKRPKGAPKQERKKAKSDAEIPLWLKLYSALQLVAIVLFSMYILWLREHHSFVVWVVAALLVLWSLSSLGALLDGDGGAYRQEALRLSCWSLAGLWFMLGPGYFWVGCGLLFAALLGLLWLFLGRGAGRG